MNEKRYTIVRSQEKCPYYEVISKKCLLDLEDCTKECINIKGKFQYGDTKEQLIRKVAQVLFRNAPQETYQPKYVEQREKILKVTKEIVEFLGVK